MAYIVLGDRLLIYHITYQIMMLKTTIGIITAISLLSLIALQTQLADATTDNASQAANQTGEQMQSGMTNMTQESKSAANQTGEQMQSGMTNVTQESKSAANQTGEEGQSMLNQTGETAQSLMNKTGETLQQINPFK
jgi:DNA anti-recombination protein RmuC